MKTIRSIKKLFILALAIALSLTVFVACGEENSGDDGVNLSAPSAVRVEEGWLVWNNVDGADGYEVSYNGAKYSTSEPRYKLPYDLSDSVTFTVCAVKGSRSSEKTEFSSRFTPKLSVPTGIRQEGDKLVWNEVEGAAYYVVKINGGEYRADLNEFTIPEGVKGVARVLAAPSGNSGVAPSDYSEEFVVSTTLSAPDGIFYRDGYIEWNAVDGADGYYVTVNGDRMTAYSNKFYVKYAYFGEIAFSVKAFSNKEGYLPSAETNSTLYVEKAKLSVPSGLSVFDGYLTFGAVEGAAAYEIYIDGEYADTIGSTVYPLPETNMSYVQVKAVSASAESSDLSEKMTVRFISVGSEADLAAMKEGGSYKLTQDIVLSSLWTPSVFKGVLDGDGHSITGITISSSSAKTGFFARLENATVKNLKLTGTINAQTSEPKMAVGALAGECVGSTIENCEIDFTVEAKTTNGVGACGGVFGTIVDSSVDNVYFNGSILAENAVCGGFVGKAYDPVNAHRISYCSANGSVTAIGGEQASCGGFIGAMLDNCLEIFACSSDCQVKGGSYVGGFVGYMGSGRISNAYSKGSVTATNASLCHVGGFIGRLEGYNNRVEYCIAMAKVEGETSGDHILVAGFVGRTVGGTYNSDIYANCFYDCTVNDMDRIGNAGSGRGDGIIKKTTEELKSAATLSAYDPSVWNIMDGELPSIVKA